MDHRCDYKEGLALAQLAPGPLAAQLAIYLGYVHYRILGATLVGIAFVLPSFLMVVALGWAYVRFGGLTWMQSVFYGVGAAVIGIIAISAYKLTNKSVGKDKLLWFIYLVLVAVTVITESEVAWLFLAAGVLVWFWRAPPKWLRQGKLNALAATPLPAASGVVSTLDWPLLSQIGMFFAKAGAFVFGSGLAIVPFLYGGVVTEHHWLNDKQFVDAVAVAMITPGPVVITVGFIGYLVAGLPGACVAAAATFLPCYLFTVLPAPYFKKYGKLRHPGIRGWRHRGRHRGHYRGGDRTGQALDRRYPDRAAGAGDRGAAAEIQEAVRTCDRCGRGPDRPGGLSAAASLRC